MWQNSSLSPGHGRVLILGSGLFIPPSVDFCTMTYFLIIADV